MCVCDSSLWHSTRFFVYVIFLGAYVLNGLDGRRAKMACALQILSIHEHNGAPNILCCSNRRPVSKCTCKTVPDVSTKGKRAHLITSHSITSFKLRKR